MGRRRRPGGGAFSREQLTPEEEAFLRHVLFGQHANAKPGLWWNLGHRFVAIWLKAFELTLRALRVILALNDETSDAGSGAGARADDPRFGQGAPPPPAPEEPGAPPGGEAPSGAAAAFAKLGLDAATADAAAVRSAFRKLSLTCHPDKCADDPTAADRFAALSRARDEALAFLCRDEGDPEAASPRRRGGDSDSGSDSGSSSDDGGGAGKNKKKQDARQKEKQRRKQQRREEAERARTRARAVHDAMRRAEEARLQQAAKEAERAAELAAMSPEARARRVHRQWDERMKEHMSAQRAAQRAQIKGSGNAAKRALAELDKPDAKARRHAAAAAEIGPPADAEAAAAAMFTPAGAYASSGAPIAVMMRARAELHAFQYLQLCSFSNSVLAVLREDCGARTTALHHAAHAGWSSGVELVLRFAGGMYHELALRRDADGATPLDVARARERDAAITPGDASLAERQKVLARLESVTTAARAAQEAAKAARAAAREAQAAAEAAKRAASAALLGKVVLGVATLPLRVARLLISPVIGIFRTRPKPPGNALG